MTDTGAGSTASPTWPEQMQWIELNALQRDLLELLATLDQQLDTHEHGSPNAVIREELAQWYGDAVPTDCLDSAFADLTDRSLVTTMHSDEHSESDADGVQYALTAAGRALLTQRVLTFTSLLTGEETALGAAASEATTEGQQ